MAYKMKKSIKDRLIDYCAFCNTLKVGDLLYNINSANAWGEYLLVATKANVYVDCEKTPYVMLLGLQDRKGEFTFNNKRIDFTLELDNMIPFLKVVGKCKFELRPIIIKCIPIKELLALYKSIDPWKYAQKIDGRKPKTKKYEKDGTKVVKRINIM